ncbi:MAG TPA: CRISPR-associated endonuclease Cas1 [Saprospiraceae bacterium]|nr:CRISPR-associated endonuclease Cas1 [Saprospiraceae bacterium]
MHIILNSYGTTLQTQQGRFVIHTQDDGKQFIPPEQIRSISISKGARVSSDAVLLAIEHEIDLLFIDGTGMPKGRVWSVQYGSISTIRKSQLEFIFSPKAVDWVKELLSFKMETQIALLLTLEAPDERVMRTIQRAVNALEDHKHKLQLAQGDIVADIAPSLRGWEGAASRRYFEALSAVLPENYQFDTRSKHPATDPFNALLNYGYGMLYGKIEGALIRAGIDPYVGIFHRDDYNRPVLVYDVIERYRVWIDYVVLQLCLQDAFPEECFIEQNGGIWLEGLGKRILIQSVNDYLAEVIDNAGQRNARITIIQQYAYQLAKFFQKTTQS